jgi:hypothetical protein
MLMTVIEMVAALGSASIVAGVVVALAGSFGVWFVLGEAPYRGTAAAVAFVGLFVVTAALWHIVFERGTDERKR